MTRRRQSGRAQHSDAQRRQAALGQAALIQLGGIHLDEAVWIREPASPTTMSRSATGEVRPVATVATLPSPGLRYGSNTTATPR